MRRLLVTAAFCLLFMGMAAPIHSLDERVPLGVVDDVASARIPPPPKKKIKVVVVSVRSADEAPLACIRRYESGGDYTAISAPGMCRGGDRRCYGAYQWNQSAWIANFGDRTPAEVSVEEQDALARNYYERRGLQPWGTKVRNNC